MCHVNEWVSMNGSTGVIVKQSVCTFMFLLLIVKELNGANGKKKWEAGLVLWVCS